uniref:Hexosyltransferase n=1 Tax=Aureoumbra lagunensis TaxID=44058 RepID=A0A7S3K201_9STRA|mmetsp:Transcript_5/g.10  ORF Transcript_5/g.10 Transcript_5/m.10 type:complete len:521 (+) Transcript_5:142-1704(+)|eukprot:CAMPEP_0197310584 /NCGR_PEP_ID=MMETSP0891-20130614/9150_1 /TAXON_ID=44058 ORGANISM="Aureoumbra lagunensis, Strain CCMP1510" /NCGR_SAMPLE_ID=MMETSP0891 /ASSEMBLY_ACC=CAM_ASM_000534 /LENGTH=520 /DNA_ID=CAMNT_0042796287 /DNA_START=64 /DNA_END=1629 /DNA_ORIENTATION=+
MIIFVRQLFIMLLLVIRTWEEEVVVIASIDGSDVPLWLNGEDESKALELVRRNNLSRRAVGLCSQGDEDCIAMLLTAEAQRIKKKETQCELRIDRPRQGEVFVLGDVEIYPMIVTRQGDEIVHLKSNYYVQAWVVLGGGALDERMQPLSLWVNDSVISLRLVPPNRRAGGGGTSKFPVRGILNISLSTKACGGEWLKAEVSIVYRPFAEPDPPAMIYTQKVLGHDRRQLQNVAIATLLYNDHNGYVHGALALFQSVLEHSQAQLLALLGNGVSPKSRSVLKGIGAILFDLEPLEVMFSKIPAAASALPALGQGQWNKLALWTLPFSRVLYIDADALVLTSAIDTLFQVPSCALAAVNDYFAGAVLLVEPNISIASFASTLAQDSGFFVYGEQDFLNVHFSGSHLRLGPEFHCLAEDTAQEHSMNHISTVYETIHALRHFPCVILEFSSCSRDGGGAQLPWKPWHNFSSLLTTPLKPVCRYPPNLVFRRFTEIWQRYYLRALATLVAHGIGSPPPFSSSSY